MKSIIPTFICLLIGFTLSAQTPTINDLSFIAGNWHTTTDWGEMQELWTPPMGNTMMGSFRCVKDGQPVFFEFMTIEQADEQAVPILYLRHFSPESVAWETKDEPNAYPLFEIGEKRAVFSSPDGETKLLFERISRKKLKITLLETEDGSWAETVFAYRLQR